MARFAEFENKMINVEMIEYIITDDPEKSSAATIHFTSGKTLPSPLSATETIAALRKSISYSKTTWSTTTT